VCIWMQAVGGSREVEHTTGCSRSHMHTTQQYTTQQYTTQQTAEQPEPFKQTAENISTHYALTQFYI